MSTFTVVLLVLLVIALLLALWDIFQRQHTVRRNFPLVGRLRYWLEAIGPELRQYIVTEDDNDRPFNRYERRWIYASAKGQNDHFSFGSEHDMERTPNYLVIKQAELPGAGVSPTNSPHSELKLPCVKILGATSGRPKAFRPSSVVNISGMSFGALSAQAVESMNRGAVLAEVLHNTGEGGLAPAHMHGADLIFQISTGYFGCRDQNGNFSIDRLKKLVSKHPVRALEIKLSQGAKPGGGGTVPAAKVTKKIADVRGVPVGEACISPSYHTAFNDVSGLLKFVETLAQETGLPVGIKSAVGQTEFWDELAQRMANGEGFIDFITVDGGEGGTGAASLSMMDHVGLPFKLAFAEVYRRFCEQGLQQDIVFIGSGRLGIPHNGLAAFALGCDMINVGREAMLSIGCIQAMRCHTGRCPTGVTTHNRWLTRGLDPNLKSVRLANYVDNLRQELQKLAHVCGVTHPSLVDVKQLEMIDGATFKGRTFKEIFGYSSDWHKLTDEQIKAASTVAE